MAFPLGTHRARPVDSTLGMTGTGKEQVAIVFERVDGEFERITWYGYFTDETFERTMEALRHLGWTGSDLSEFLNGLPAGVENEVDVVVEDEEYEGKLRRKVKWVNSGAGVAVKDRLTDDAARSFAARMKQRIAANQAKAGSQPAAQRKPTPTQNQGRAVAAAVSRGPERTIDPGIDDADIPF